MSDGNSTEDPLDGAMHTVWLEGDWYDLTQRMSPEHREAAADAVERYSEHLHPGGGVILERWWRDET